MIVASGRFEYRANPSRAKLPNGRSFKEVGRMAVDRTGNRCGFN